MAIRAVAGEHHDRARVEIRAWADLTDGSARPCNSCSGGPLRSQLSRGGSTMGNADGERGPVISTSESKLDYDYEYLVRRPSRDPPSPYRRSARRYRIREPGNLCRRTAHAVPGRPALPVQAQSALQTVDAAARGRGLLDRVSAVAAVEAGVPAAGRLLVQAAANAAGFLDLAFRDRDHSRGGRGESAFHRLA